MNRPFTFVPLFALRGTALVAAALFVGCADGEDPELAFHRGLNAVEDERFDLARTYFEQALQARPEHEAARRQLCLAWRRGADQALVPSVDAMQRYLRAVPDDQEILRLLVETHVMLGRPEAAAETLDALDDSPAAWRLRARALLEIEIEAADRAATRALELDPEAPAAHLLAADVARKAGERGRERRHLEEAVARDPLDDRARYRLGRALVLEGDRTAGSLQIEIAGRVAELRTAAAPRSGSAIAALRILESLGEILDASHPRLAALEARLLLEAGRIDEGFELVSTLESDGALSTPERIALAGILARGGRRAEALRRYERLLAAEPSLRAVRLALARLHRARGETQTAESLLRDGLTGEPFVAHFHAELADLAIQEGDTAAAAAALRSALRLAPWAARWRVELARIEITEGRRDEAERVLAATPEPSPLIERFRSRHGLQPPPGRGAP